MSDLLLPFLLNAVFGFVLFSVRVSGRGDVTTPLFSFFVASDSLFPKEGEEKQMRNSMILGSGVAGVAMTLAAGAAADITGAVTVDYSVTAEDFGGTAVSVNVSDLYLLSDDAADVVLNVYNFEPASSAQVDYYQSLGSDWTPENQGGIFDTPALRLADSFVTIGGFTQDTLRPEQFPGAGAGTVVSPGSPPSGWYTGSPPSLNGQVGMLPLGLGVLIGRFAYDGDFSLANSTLGVTWNQGLGTPGIQAGFEVFLPAPGVLALLGLAGLAGRRRRNG